VLDAAGIHNAQHLRGLHPIDVVMEIDRGKLRPLDRVFRHAEHRLRREIAQVQGDLARGGHHRDERIAHIT